MTEENSGNAENTEGAKSRKRDDDSFRHYPGRLDKRDFTWYQRLFLETTDSRANKLQCEENVIKAFEKNPIVRILKEALKSAGCPVNLRRHVVCEDCSRKVQGGYDFEYNQIVVCKNLPHVRSKPDALLVHELVHMYDNCVNQVNFKDLEHLACTEIRAANIAHCSFLYSIMEGYSSVMEIKKAHQYCVKARAAKSVSVARNIDFPTAVKYVLKVFDKCYNDLEPVGRRIRRHSDEGLMAEEEAKCFFLTSDSE